MMKKLRAGLEALRARLAANDPVTRCGIVMLALCAAAVVASAIASLCGYNGMTLVVADALLGPERWIVAHDLQIWCHAALLMLNGVFAVLLSTCKYTPVAGIKAAILFAVPCLLMQYIESAAVMMAATVIHTMVVAWLIAPCWRTVARSIITLGLMYMLTILLTVTKTGALMAIGELRPLTQSALLCIDTYVIYMLSIVIDGRRERGDNRV